jgi:hypothetical protein
MTKLVSLLICYIVYSFIYLMPLAVAMLICEGLNINVEYYLSKMESIRPILGIVRVPGRLTDYDIMETI